MRNFYIILVIFSVWTVIAQKPLSEKQKLEFDNYFFDAINERLKNNYKKSNEYFEQCLAIDDQNDVIYFKIAQNYLDAKKYEKALQYVKQARNLNSVNKWYHKLYIDIKIANGTSKEELKQLIKEFEPIAQNKYLIRSLYRKMYRKTKQVNYEKYRRLSPLISNSTLNNITILWQQKKYQSVLKIGEKMLDDQPDNPQIYLYMAKSYLELTKPKRALEYLEMGYDFVLHDKNMQKQYYKIFIKIYKILNKTEKVKQYQSKLEKL